MVAFHFGGLAWGEGAFGELGELALLSVPDGREWQLLVHKLGTDLPVPESIDWVIGGDRLPDPPSGVGSQTLRVLEGKLESQPYSVRVADPAGEITAKVFEGGRLRAHGRWVEVRTRRDGSAWQRVDLRRITRAVSPDPISWEFELTSDNTLARDVVFATSSDIQLYPLGPRVAWHRHPAAGYSDPLSIDGPGEVLEVDDDNVRISLETIPVPRDLVGVVRDELAGLRLEVDEIQYDVLSFGASPSPMDAEEAVGIWVGEPPRLPSSVWVAWPGHTLSVEDNVGALRLWWPEGVPTSPVTPRLIGPAIDPVTGEVAGSGYRLDALVEDVLKGEYGGRRMPFDAAAVEAIADLSDEGHWFAVAQEMTRGEFLQRAVWRPYVLAPQMDADGALSPAIVWAGDAVQTTGLYRFDGSNVASQVRYEGGGAQVANVWKMSILHADRRLPADGVIFPWLDLQPVTRTRRMEDSSSVDEPFEIDASNQVLRRVWSQAAPDLYSARVFALAGDGAGTYRFTAAVTEDAPRPGDLAVLVMSELRAPEAQSAGRSGDRVGVVIERTRTYGPGTVQYDYLLWDAGWRAHSSSHVDAAHADSHSDSGAPGHFDAHADEHIDEHADETHSDNHADTEHTDVHNDGAHSDEHGDSAEHTDLHVDAEHSDQHADVPHSDNHFDSSHGDSHDDGTFRSDEIDHCDALLEEGPICFHEDSHFDSSHSDSHSDSAHSDTHSDAAHDDQHADIDHSDFHNDGGHSDAHADASHGDDHADSEHSDEHSDLAHADLHQDGSHDDAHEDGAHSDWHDDTAHTDLHEDAGHQDEHGDSEHTDGHADGDPHEDTHGDVNHSDFHLDGGHADEHGDTPGDPEHSDSHQDLSHTDTHTDEAHEDSHSDTGHEDIHSDQEIEDTHDDVTGFIDELHDDGGLDPECDPELEDGIPCHGDAHGDVSEHGDSHSDQAHTDIHDDTAHDDSHGDVPHADDHDDEPAHQDTHEDAAHSDLHGDTAHADAHDDVAHDDSHEDAGHDDAHDDSEHTDEHSDSEHSDAHRDQDHSDVHADLVN